MNYSRHQGSISHKEQLAVAIALCLNLNDANCTSQWVGVDIERCSSRQSSTSTSSPARLLQRLLSEREQAHQENMMAARRVDIDDIDEEDTMLRFSFKEALFKALHPSLLRPVGFQEAEVFPSYPIAASEDSSDDAEEVKIERNGSAVLHFHLSGGELFDYSAQVPKPLRLYTVALTDLFTQWWRIRSGKTSYWLTAVHLHNPHRNTCD